MHRRIFPRSKAVKCCVGSDDPIRLHSKSCVSIRVHWWVKRLPWSYAWIWERPAGLPWTAKSNREIGHGLGFHQVARITMGAVEYLFDHAPKLHDGRTQFIVLPMVEQT